MEQVNKVFGRLLGSLVAVLPNLLLAISLLVVGWTIAFFVGRIVKRLILYLNRVANENLQSRFLNIDLKGTAVFVSKTLYWLILLITILSCIYLLKLDILSDLLKTVISFLPNIFIAVAIFFVGLITARLANDLIKSAASRTGFVSGKYLGYIVRYVILFVTVVIAIDQLGVNIGFLTNLIIIFVAAILFAAALAFGLGAQSSVDNILAAYYIRKHFKLGDKVKVGQSSGVIIKITDNAVELETTAGRVHIPAKVFNESVATTTKEK